MVVMEASGDENPVKTFLVMASERYASAPPMHVVQSQPDQDHHRLIGALPPPHSLNYARPPVQHILYGLRLPLQLSWLCAMVSLGSNAGGVR